MKSWIFRGCIVLLASMWILPHSGFAQLDNTQNPLTAKQHAGAAHEIAVQGLKDASNESGGQEDALVNVIKGGVNWVLGILALIALIILLYGGFLMVTAAGDEEKYNKGWTILRQAAIGLLIIGVAWFIVSIIFWLVNKTTDGVAPAGTDQ